MPKYFGQKQTWKWRTATPQGGPIARKEYPSNFNKSGSYGYGKKGPVLTFTQDPHGTYRYDPTNPASEPLQRQQHAYKQRQNWMKWGRHTRSAAFKFMWRWGPFGNPLLDPGLWPYSPFNMPTPATEPTPAGYDMEGAGFTYQWGHKDNCNQLTNQVVYTSGCLNPASTYECLGGQAIFGPDWIPGDTLSVPANMRGLSFTRRYKVGPIQRTRMHEHWCRTTPLPAVDIPWQDEVPGAPAKPGRAKMAPPEYMPNPIGDTPFETAQLPGRTPQTPIWPTPENPFPGGGNSGGGGASGDWSPVPATTKGRDPSVEPDWEDEEVPSTLPDEAPIPRPRPAGVFLPENAPVPTPRPPFYSPPAPPRTQWPRPPGRNEKEDKVKLFVQKGWFGALHRLYGSITEIEDVVDALIDSYVGDAWRPYGRPLQDKLRWLYKHWSGIDSGKAIYNVLQDHLEDWAIGAPSAAVGRALGNAARRGYGSGRGGPGYTGVSRPASYGTRF